MPIYEYRCTRCGHQFEVTHAVGENVESCERCRAPVRRVFSPVGIIFKGPGFYATDHRKAGSQASDSSGGDGKAAEKGGSAAPSPEKSGGETSTAASGTGAGKRRS